MSAVKKKEGETVEATNDKQVLWNVEDAASCCELGQQLFYHSEPGSQAHKDGISLLVKAANLGEPEAQYIIGWLLTDGALRLNSGDSVAHGKRLLWESAKAGCQRARRCLDGVCTDQYKENRENKDILAGYCGPLVDFSRRKIVINRTGLLTPVDARLIYKDGTNLLTLDVNLAYIVDEEANWDLLKRAVREGILMWQGDYTVFGGQNLTLKINLTEEKQLFDSVYIMPLTTESEATARKMAETIHTKAASENIKMLFDEKRSAAMTGIKWSVRSRKLIYIQQPIFDQKSYKEVVHIVKHEFGHVLGLGDLYCENGKLNGVFCGEYEELDGYHITNRVYNLVMCDHHGIISNNDIEMVLLAFSENQRQNYQEEKYGGEISEALGRGN